MKNIIYLLLLLFCFAGCKKTAQDSQLRFTKVSFKLTGTLGSTMILYEGKKYRSGTDIGLSYGDNQVQILNGETGSVMLDTVLNIIGPDTFEIRKSGNSSDKVMLVRSPLSGEAAAPYGFMKLKIANHAANALPYPKIDIVVRSFYPVNGVYTAIDTIKGIGTDYNKQLFLVKRALTNGVVVEQFQLYRFSFINSATGEPIKNASGNLFTEITFAPDKNSDSLYMFELIEYNDSFDPPNSIHQGAEFYDLEVFKSWNR